MSQCMLQAPTFTKNATRLATSHKLTMYMQIKLNLKTSHKLNANSTHTSTSNFRDHSIVVSSFGGGIFVTDQKSKAKNQSKVFRSDL